MTVESWSGQVGGRPRLLAPPTVARRNDSRAGLSLSPPPRPCPPFPPDAEQWSACFDSVTRASAQLTRACRSPESRTRHSAGPSPRECATSPTSSSLVSQAPLPLIAGPLARAVRAVETPLPCDAASSADTLLLRDPATCQARDPAAAAARFRRSRSIRSSLSSRSCRPAQRGGSSSGTAAASSGLSRGR